MIWSLNNSTRYAAAATLAADRDGHDIWLTVVKASFDIAADGMTTPSDEQRPIVYAPRFAGDPMRSSLLADSDIDYGNVGVDVLVQGTVQATGDRSVRDRVVMLEVAGRRKRLRVHGERDWCRRSLGVAPSSAKPFTPVPLDYEHAFGGFDPTGDGDHCAQNPAGCGYAKNTTDLLGLSAPRIEYCEHALGAGDVVPAGFGPIARHWLPRRSFAGTYGEAWLEQRMPLLPDDFDERFFLAAPADQQFAQLPRQAVVRLDGMTPDQGLVFALPRLAFGVTVHTTLRALQRHPQLRSVLVLPDTRQVVLTYADAMRCTGSKYQIRDAEVVEKMFIQ